jgi:hypothetical protein
LAPEAIATALTDAARAADLEAALGAARHGHESEIAAVLERGRTLGRVD